MPKYCLSEYIGAGTDADPYRPLGVEQGMIWSSIDFRPDSTVLDGFCIVALPDDATIPKRAQLVSINKVERLSLPAKTLFANKIGLNIDSQNFDEILLELLTTHSTPPNDKTRWNPIAPTVDKRFEIWLGEKVVDIPFVSGGATYTESFNTADSGTVGPDLTWSVSHTYYGVEANEGKIDTTTGGGNVRARAQSDMAGNDNYAQFIIRGASTNTSNQWGTACRFSSAADTCYVGTQGDGSTLNNTRVAKVVTAILTSLATSTHTKAVDEVLKVEASGSSITLYFNAVSNVNVTDTAITTGLRGGMACSASGTTRVYMDSFEMGDVATSATTSPSTISRSFAINAPALNSTHDATVIARSFAINSPTLTADSTIAPSTIARSFAMPAPTTVGGSGAYPDALSMSVSFPAPTVTGDSVTTDPTGSGNSLNGKRRRGSTIGKGKSGR